MRVIPWGPEWKVTPKLAVMSMIKSMIEVSQQVVARNDALQHECTYGTAVEFLSHLAHDT